MNNHNVIILSIIIAIIIVTILVIKHKQTENFYNYYPSYDPSYYPPYHCMETAFGSLNCYPPFFF